jgi:ADP-ribose pyrophosphatase
MMQFKDETNEFTTGIRGAKSPFSPDVSPGRLLYEDRYQKIYNFKADFGTYEKEYFIRDSGTRTGMIALKDKCVLLVRQYRLFVNRLSLEIPGGGLDEGESPELSAVRECFEETGIHCHNPKQLIFYHVGLDAVYNPTYIFYSDHISETYKTGKINSDEINGWEWVSLDRCIDMIKKGEVIDSFTIIGILAYQTFISNNEVSS